MITFTDQLLLNIFAFLTSLIFLGSSIVNYRKNSLRSLTFLFAAISFVIKTSVDFLIGTTAIYRIIFSMTFINFVIMLEYMIAKLVLNDFESIKTNNNAIEAVKKTRKISIASSMFKAIRSISIFHLFFIISTYFNFITVKNYDIYNCIAALAFLIVIIIYGVLASKNKIIFNEILIYCIFRLICFLIIINNFDARLIYIICDIASSCTLCLMSINWRASYDKCD